MSGNLGGIRDIAIDAAGDALVAGSKPFTERRGTDFAVVKLAGSDGSERWHRILSGNDSRRGGTRAIATAVAVKSDGNVVAAGAVERGGFRNSCLVVELASKSGHRRWKTQLQGQSGGLNSLAVGPFGIAVGGALGEPGAEPWDSVASFVVAQVAGSPPLASDVRVYK